MSQTRLGSLAESCTNIFVGYCINFIANLIVLPIFVEGFTVGDNLILGVIYTGIAFVRNYVVRRWFVRKE